MHKNENLNRCLRSINTKIEQTPDQKETNGTGDVMCTGQIYCDIIAAEKWLDVETHVKKSHIHKVHHKADAICLTSTRSPQAKNQTTLA